MNFYFITKEHLETIKEKNVKLYDIIQWILMVLSGYYQCTHFQLSFLKNDENNAIFNVGKFMQAWFSVKCGT